MNSESNSNSKYMIAKAAKGGKSVFVSITDGEAIETFRKQHSNKDLLCSMCLYGAPDSSAERIYPLYFGIISNDLEKTRISVLEACYYIAQNFGIAEACLETIYNGGGSAGECTDADGNSTENANHSRYPGGGDGKNIEPDESGDNSRRDGNGASKSSTDAAAAEIMMSIPPAVFEGWPTAFMLAINYRLAR